MTGETLLDRLRSHAEQDLTYLLTPRRSLSYRALLTDISAFSVWLQRSGFGPGDRIAIAATEPVAVTVCLLTALVRGLTAVIVPVAGPAVNGARSLARAHACKLIVTDTAAGPRLELLAPRVDAAEGAGDGAVAFIDALQQAGPQVSLSAVQPAEPAIVIFSSGTTAVAKGIRWSHGALDHHLRTYQQTLRYRPGQRLFNGLPLEHTDGLFHGLLVTAWGGMTWVRPPPFSIAALDDWRQLAQRQRPQVLVAVPALLRLLRTTAAADAFRGLELIVSSADRLDLDTWRYFDTNIAPVANIYGASETINGGLFALPWESAIDDSIGRPVDMQAEVRDEHGRSLPPGEIGRLYLMGDNLFAGYETGEAFEPAPLTDGWLAMADNAVRLPDGRFRIVGRADEARNVGGVLVHPAAIDLALQQLPYVIASQTIMRPTVAQLQDFSPVSFVIASEAVDPARIRHDLQQRLPAVRCPREVVVLDELPATAVGKVDRPALHLLLDDREAQNSAGNSHGPDAIAERIVNCAARVLALPAGKLSLDSRYDTVVGWDSFGHINLALAIERQFGVRMSYAEVTRAASLRDFETIVSRRLTAAR